VDEIPLDERDVIPDTADAVDDELRRTALALARAFGYRYGLLTDGTILQQPLPQPKESADD